MIHTIQKHIHKVEFYPNADNFTQALLAMLVTIITSVMMNVKQPHCLSNQEPIAWHEYDIIIQISVDKAFSKSKVYQTVNLEVNYAPRKIYIQVRSLGKPSPTKSDVFRCASIS